MPTKRERRVPQKERPNSLLDWEAAHIFLEIAQAGSFRAAAEKLGHSVNGLRRRFAKLEREIGTTLLTRHVDGVRLTPEGERMLHAAQAMELASFELMRGNKSGKDAVAGEVKLASTEGTGMFWIAPQLAACRDRHPELVLNLQCTMSPVDVLRLEADIAVQLVRPTAKDLKIVKLGRLHVVPFASQGYAQRYGIPKGAHDLIGHRMLWQSADQTTVPSNFPAHIQAVMRTGAAAMRTNASGAHYMAVAGGLAIGSLPSYARVLDPSLIPVDIECMTQHDIWLVYHPDSGRIPRVQAVLEWLIEIFSPKRYPWFGDRFIHPNDLHAEGPYEMSMVAPGSGSRHATAKTT